MEAVSQEEGVVDKEKIIDIIKTKIKDPLIQEQMGSN